MPWIPPSDKFGPSTTFVALIIEKDDTRFARRHAAPRQMLFPVLEGMIS
jgi:hypothetical protein